MNNVIDLEEEREIKALIERLGRLISINPECLERTFSALDGELDMVKNQDAVILSVRLPKALINRLDDFAREIAYREKRKVTRSTLVAEWLEASLREYEKQRRLHQAEDEAVL